MRNKIFAILIFILSVLISITSFKNFKLYNYIKLGNKLTESANFEEGRKNYNNALKIKKENGIEENILKSFYSEKKYEDVIKLQVDESFLKGNSYAFLGDNSSEKKEEFYKKAVEEYKKVMCKSNDINIKKNYELILNKLNENKNNQENTQKNDENNKSDNNSKDQQKNSDNTTQNNNKNQQSSSQDNSDSQKNNNLNKDNSEENSDKESSKDSTNNKNNSFNSTSDSSSKQADTKKEEIKVILKRLEGNEKQAFKNNERVININNNDSSNRW